jgi:cytochrome c biogenesis protein CcdA
MAEPGARARGAVVAGAGLFVLGFAVFFTLIGGAFGALGAALAAQRESLGRIGGVLVAGLGLFLLGVWRPRRLERKRRAVGWCGGAGCWPRSLSGWSSVPAGRRASARPRPRS